MLEAMKFTSILLMTIFTFAVEAIKFIGEFSIQFSNVLAKLIHALTPIALGMLEFFTKCVGGLYWLVYVLIKQPPNAPVAPRAILDSQRYPKTYDKYYNPDFVHLK